MVRKYNDQIPNLYGELGKMTDNQEIKPKKLTLSGTKLSLGNRSITSSALKQSFITSRSSTVTVEVKQNKTSSLSLSKKPMHQTQDNNISDNTLSPELSKKLSIFKNAERIKAEEALEEKPKERIGALSFASKTPDVKVKESEIDVPAVKQEKEFSTSKSSHHIKKIDEDAFDDEETT